MRSPLVPVGLLSLVAISIVGCAAVTNVASSRQVNMVAIIKSNQAQQTRRSPQEGIVTANIRQSSALAESTSTWDYYRIRLALLLEAGKSEGEAVCELEETYRTHDRGVYAVRLDGVVESGPILADTIESGLKISIEVRSSVNNVVVGQMHKTIRSRKLTIDGHQRLWISPTEELKPLIIEMEADVQYLVQTRMTLSAQSESEPDNAPMSIEGEFRLILEPLEQVQIREELAKSLAQKLIELWVREDAKLAEDPQLQGAANTLSRLFMGEAVRYVDIHAPAHNRSACFEHARIVREWYEIRMRLNLNLARWFRMTTIRRNTPFHWQSSNLITPNLSALPDRWLDDGTGIIVEVKDAGISSFYGRYISAKEFCKMSLRPKIQQTARIPSLNIE
ncbi:MAG: hypothetical protein NUV86_13075 [Candidatus Scalindua sp.]|nr:hypothetical protein [Candidatus Scalindua sp.]MCR4345315.1 hypothetical protein [Candidatus Scalindua sp.]